MFAISTAYYYDERCLAHDNGSMILDPRAGRWLDVPHVERPERLARTASVLEQSGVSAELDALPSRAATRAELELAHTPRMIDELAAACARREHLWSGPRRGSDRKAGSPRRWRRAERWRSSTRSSTAPPTMASRSSARPAITRPPTRQWASACSTTSRSPPATPRLATRIERVAIVDWDVHHGNGTEAIFYDDPSVLFVSIHQDDLYPIGAGALEHAGEGEGEGVTVNIPLPAGSGDDGYLLAFERLVEPALAAFRPDLLFVSAGQDPAASDPLGRMSVTTEGFRELTGARGDCRSVSARAGSRSCSRAATASSTCPSATWRSSRRWPASSRRCRPTRSSSTCREACARSSKRRSSGRWPRTPPVRCSVESSALGAAQRRRIWNRTVRSRLLLSSES